MKHRYPIGSFVRFRNPDEEGRLTDGRPMSCRVLEHMASDSVQPMYEVQEGILCDQRYQLIASEDELEPCV